MRGIPYFIPGLTASLKNAMEKKSERSNFLNELVSKHAITPDGRDWLVTALDPFHDFNHNIAGYPDADVSQTVVSMFQYTLEVTRPPGLAATDNWDCHLYTLPTLQAATYGVYNQAADWSTLTEPNPVVNNVQGLLNVVTGAVGTDLVPTIPASATKVFQTLPSAPEEELASGTSRVIAMGFEVHNTTADIYKQGGVTSYRMPQMHGMNQAVFSNNGGTSRGVVVGIRASQPPPNLLQAQRLKGTRTWDARDGLYSTALQSTVHNPLVQDSTLHIVYGATPDSGAASVAWASPLTSVGAGAFYVPAATKYNVFDTSGAFFTGLSPQTSLLIKLRVYVEKAPTWQEPQLAPLASPSAGYDINALQLYAQAVNMLPVGVKVGENAAGDWFKSVLSVLRHVAGPLGTALNTFVPGAGLAGSAVSSLLGQLDTRKPISTQAVAKMKQTRPRKRAPK